MGVLCQKKGGEMADPWLEKKFNFGQVSTGAIYRSAQPSKEFLDYLKKQYRIKTIIVFRTEVNQKEKEFCDENNVKLIQLPIKTWRRWPAPNEARGLLKLLESPTSLPILLHCRAGKDRTSAMVALYRLGCQGWSLEEVMREMKLWRANWFWRLYIQTSANKVLSGFEEKNIFLLYLKRFLNLIFGIEGLVYAVKREKNIQLFLIAEAVFLGIALWRGVSIAELGILLFSGGVLIAFEMFNSSIERLTDLVHPQFDPKVKIIKDLLAGGMLLIGMMIFIIWLIVVFL